jgi:hypothetical protein
LRCDQEGQVVIKMSDWTKSQGEILPLILSFFGLYPREDTVPLQRLIRAAQCVYWIGCGVFLLINSTSSAYIIVKNLITPVSQTPLLDALVEALFTIESNRGIFLCLILAFFCKNGLRQMVQETENLGNFFQMDKSFGRKIRHVTLTLVGLISIFQFSEKFFGFYTWLIVYRSKGLEFAPYFELSPRLAIPSFGFFAMIPDFLARVVLTLVFVSGFVLLACLNTISKNFSCYRRFGKLKDLRSSRRQYYVLASLLENLNANLGTLLAISLLADLAPVCGRVARLLFPIPDSTQISQTASIAKNVFLILIGALFYIICLHLPFVLLHKKVIVRGIFISVGIHCVTCNHSTLLVERLNNNIFD